MIDKYTKFVAGEGSNQAEFVIDPKPDEQLHVRIKISGKEAVIPFKDLYSFVFFTATDDQQAELMPVRETLVKKIVKRHIVEATKNIKRGEKISIRCETDVPVEIFEGIVAEKRLRNPTTKATMGGLPIIGAK